MKEVSMLVFLQMTDNQNLLWLAQLSPYFHARLKSYNIPSTADEYMLFVRMCRDSYLHNKGDDF